MYIFVIDTEQYSGNFERDLTAFVTGLIGDCGVGKDAADAFYKQMGLKEESNPFDFVFSRPDEYGCMRPTSIWPTPGWFNDGMGGHYRDGEEQLAHAHHREECLNEAARKSGVHPSDYDAHRQRWTERADEPLQKFPAYQSVAIFMNREPTDEEVRLLKERAFKFNDWGKTQNFFKPITITGFRLIEQKTSEKQLKSWGV